MTSVQKKWLYRALIMLIFIFAFGIRAYNLNGKQGLYMDENLSFILSEYKDLGWSEDIAEGTYTVAELKAAIYAPTDSSFKGALSDVVRLWESTRDSPHANLYYSALRLSLVGVEASDNLMQELIFRAGILNLLTFTAVFIASFVMLRLLLNKRGFILLGLVVLSFNPFDIGNALFFRPYMLQTLFIVVFTSYLIYITKQLRAGVYTDSWQNLLKFGFVMSLMLWAGYYGFIYGFFIGISFVWFVLRPCGKLNLIPYFFFASFVAVAFDTIYYQEFFQGFYQYRTIEAASSAFSIKDTFIELYLKLVRYNLAWTLYLFPFFLVLLIIVCKKKKMVCVGEYSWIIAASILACIFILFISPIKTPRYLIAFMPVFLISIPLACFCVRNNIFRIVSSIFIILLFSFAALFSMKINMTFNMNHQYKTRSNSINKRGLPVYLTSMSWAKDNRFIFMYRSIRVASMNNNDSKVIVSDIDIGLDGLSKEEAFAKMRENFEMPKEFVLYYMMPDGHYHSCVFETKD